MVYREMNFEAIEDRINRGDLVVYLQEEYGYRYWFWFPNMSECELEDFWKNCDIEDYFFSPVSLPGDVVPVSYVEIPIDAFGKSDACSHTAYVLGIHSLEKDLINEHIEWLKVWHPDRSIWSRGWYAKNTWRAHSHQADDSWLKKPE